MSTVYIVFAKFDRLSFDRHERFIRPAVAIHEGVQNVCDHLKDSSEEHDLSSTARVCCFLLAMVAIVPCTYRGVVVPVDSAEGKVFLNLLVIGWKGMMNLGSLGSMFDKFPQLVYQLTGPLRMPSSLLQALLYPTPSCCSIA